MLRTLSQNKQTCEKMSIRTILIILSCVACSTRKPTTSLEKYPLDRQPASKTGSVTKKPAFENTIIVRDLSNGDTYEVSDPFGVFAITGSCARATIYFLPDTTVAGEIAQCDASKCPEEAFKPKIKVTPDTLFKITYVKRIE